MSSLFYCIMPNHPLKERWYGIKARSAKKGIYVHEEWLDSYSCFKSWAYQNGYVEYQKGQVLVRIDNTQGFYPENCKFVHSSESGKYRSTTKINDELINKCYELSETMSQQEIAKEIGLHYSTVSRILSYLILPTSGLNEPKHNKYGMIVR